VSGVIEFTYSIRFGVDVGDDEKGTCRVEAKIIQVRWWRHNYSCGFIGTDAEVGFAFLFLYILDNEFNTGS
jgi:hypothetical protein